MTTEELIAAYLAKGGKVTTCQPSSRLPGLMKLAPSVTPAKRERRDPWWVRSDWKLVKVPADQIAAAERWLREREITFYTNMTKIGGYWHVRIADPRRATLFKLTWGSAA